jgi:hypothetical protein
MLGVQPASGSAPVTAQQSTCQSRRVGVKKTLLPPPAQRVLGKRCKVDCQSLLHTLSTWTRPARASMGQPSNVRRALLEICIA